ncbi:PepSY domain-containing protein [Blastopirellula sp. J2-11]|uniref:PepSY-associated TM helix domain-containing protein n=1 Tax=Blastopirellula sp. J2-11 TaxID=2943192 RepID=UPI0021CA0C09|nr:PepSY-associated TM helix domain-containing protein [Blastopirellula sp. J2-11]UUO08400.1 PepSY domain-containing protein [Blastopirellula sp. J2-11]
MRLIARRIWLKVHLYLGLTAGLIFALAGVTGSILVFEHAFDENLNAEMMLTENRGERRSLEEITALAQQQFPELGHVERIAVPRTEENVYYVRFNAKSSGGKPVSTEVFYDPYTAESLGQRPERSGLIAWIYDLHARLQFGKTGRILMGVIALTVIISIITGIVLWWPLQKGGWRIAWGIRRNKLNFDLHKTSGLLMTPPLLLIAFTGVYLGLPFLVKPVVGMFSIETKNPQKVTSVVPTSPTDPIGPDRAAQLAAEVMPGSELFFVHLPQRADDTYKVFVRQQGEIGQLRGTGRIWLDQYSGEVRATRDWSKFTFADTYYRIQLALHCGDAFGFGGRLLFFVVGFVPAALYVTGFLLWWRKKMSRRRQLQNRPAARSGNSAEIAPLAAKLAAEKNSELESAST